MLIMNQSYINALIGGVLIGISALVLIGGIGRIMGIGGILKSILPRQESGLWRYLFLVGIPTGVWVYLLLYPSYTVFYPDYNLGLALAGGLLV